MVRIPVTPKDLWILARQSVEAWLDDYAPSMGAAIAYYTLFSLAPLLVVVVAVAGLVFGPEAARGEIVGQLGGLIGESAASAIQALLVDASQPVKSTVASVTGLITLVLGATAVFVEVQSAFDRIWRAPVVKHRTRLWSLLHRRLLSFAIILVIGFLLLVSLGLSAVVSALSVWGRDRLAGWDRFLEVENLVAGFVVTTVLVATIYHTLPRVRVAWTDVWIGALVTAFMFTVGKSLIGLYLARASVTSGFGAAGSMAVLLLWVYYSSQIFLLGAEFTWVFAHRHGSRAGMTSPPNIEGHEGAKPSLEKAFAAS